MRITALGGLEFPGRSWQRARLGSGRAVSAAILIGLVAVLALIVANLGSARRDLQALPAGLHAALYARTVADLREFCGADRPDGLRDHCRTLAEFAVQFEECRAECAALARHQLVVRPTR